MFKEHKGTTSTAASNDTPKYVQRYIENFIDLAENVPNDLSRSISQVHELQLKYENQLNKFENYLIQFTRHKSALQQPSAPSNRTKTSAPNGTINQNFVTNYHQYDDINNPKLVKIVLSIQKCLTQMQELSDSKLAILQEAVEQLDNKSRELDHDYKLINLTQNDGAETSTKKEKNNGANKSQTSSTNTQPKNQRESPEPTYCVCHQVSYGDMICCDNDNCEIEWFHFQCVSLATKPKGKWYCPKCRGDRSNQPKK